LANDAELKILSKVNEELATFLVFGQVLDKSYGGKRNERTAIIKSKQFVVDGGCSHY
jgi:hypothetical protein